MSLPRLDTCATIGTVVKRHTRRKAGSQNFRSTGSPKIAGLPIRFIRRDRRPSVVGSPIINLVHPLPAETIVPSSTSVRRQSQREDVRIGQTSGQAGAYRYLRCRVMSDVAIQATCYRATGPAACRRCRNCLLDDHGQRPGTDNF